MPEGKLDRWAPLALFLLALPIYLAGIRGELPYFYDLDERMFVRPPVQMVANGDLDPYWFGHPGSTVMYPLALLLRLREAVGFAAPLYGPDRRILDRFRADPAPFYVIGRGLSALYATLSIPLVFWIGRRAFSPKVALVGALWALLPPVILVRAQMVRSDSAALFWGLLALLLMLRASDQPSRARWIAAGAVVGIAGASRYFMIVLAVPFAALMADGVRRAEPAARRSAIAWTLVALAAIPVGFLLVTPYLVPEWDLALDDIQGEAQESHYLASGLSFAGNLRFYLAEVWPANLGWPITVLAGCGAALAALWGSRAQRTLVLFVVVFLSAISVSSLHWSRWTIQALPIATLLAADALERATGRRPPLWLAAVLLASLLPIHSFVVAEARQVTATTRLLAHDWALAALPAEAALVETPGLVPLVAQNQVLEFDVEQSRREVPYAFAEDGKNVRVRLLRALPASPDAWLRFRDAAPTYLVIRGEPLRSALPPEVSLVAHFEHSWFRDGPDIVVYRIAPMDLAPAAK
jgi:hypothetical protein